MTADTVAAALLRTAALYLAGEGKEEKFREPSKEPSTFLVELLKTISKERRKEHKRKVRKGSRINTR